MSAGAGAFVAYAVVTLYLIGKVVDDVRLLRARRSASVGEQLRIPTRLGAR